MSDNPTIPPGWYHAEGDPPNSQRFWDGVAWRGEPQPIAPAMAANVPMDSMPGSGPSATLGMGSGSSPATYGQRAIAFVIDTALWVGGSIAASIIGAVVGAVDQTAGDLVGGGLTLALIGVVIWNVVFLQGGTGQSIGKRTQGISLRSDATGEPVGAGMAFVRLLVATALSVFTCYLGGILDLLWPLWDPERRRLTDKILKFSVVKV